MRGPEGTYARQVSRLLFLALAAVLACGPVDTRVKTSPSPSTTLTSPPATPAPPRTTLPTHAPTVPVFRTSMTLAAVDAAHAWTTGSDDSGIIVAATSDGGRTWDKRRLPGEIALAGQLTFVDATFGWLVARVSRTGERGDCLQLGRIPPGVCASAVYGTSDGGRTWTEQVRELVVTGPISSGSFGFLTATDARHAWIASEDPCGGPDCSTRILATADGTSWRTIATLPARVGSLDFVDESTGFAAALEPGTTAGSSKASILATSDGGRTWTSRLEVTGSAGLAFDFVDRERGYAITVDPSRCSMGGCGVALSATVDGGRTWRAIHPSDESWWPRATDSSGAGFLRPPRFVSAAEGWIGIGTGAGPSVGGVLHTLDGGRTFTRSDGERVWQDVALVPVTGAVWAAALKYGDDSSPAIYRSVDGLIWERTLEARF